MLRTRWSLIVGIAGAVGAGLLLTRAGTAQQPAPDRVRAENAAPVAQDATAAAIPQEPLSLKFYDIQDFIEGIPGDASQPDVVPLSFIDLGWGRYSGGGGGGGGLYGGGAGDKERSARAGSIDADAIIDLIKREVGNQDEVWKLPLRIENFGGMLVVRHTAAVHRDVAALLEQLRAAQPVGRSIDAVAHWVLVNPAELSTLYKPDSREIDAARLAALPPGVLYARLAVRTVTGQTIILHSGRANTFITDQNPSIGQNTAAFDPEVRQVLSGALVQMNVMLRGSSAMVNVVAGISDRDKSEKPAVMKSIRGARSTTENLDEAGKVVDRVRFDPAEGFDAVAEVDRVNMVDTHLRTIARLPLGKPILIGGMTLEPATGATISKGDPRQLYLIMQVDLAEAEAAKPAAK